MQDIDNWQQPQDNDTLQLKVNTRKPLLFLNRECFFKVVLLSPKTFGLFFY